MDSIPRLNVGNQTVISDLRVLDKTPGTMRKRWFVWDSTNLLAYLMQPGWLLEHAEYEDQIESVWQAQSLASLPARILIKGWTPVIHHRFRWSEHLPNTEVTQKVLAFDEGLYRVRWIYPERQGNNFFKYSNSRVTGRVLDFDHSGILKLLQTEPERWALEYLDLSSNAWMPADAGAYVPFAEIPLRVRLLERKQARVTNSR